MKVLIIGGSSDVGISLAKYLTNMGNEVTITYHNHKCEIDNIKSVHLDIRNEMDIQELMKELGHIDLLINMAAISRDNLFLDTTKEDFKEVLDVNLIGTFSTSKIFSKYNPNGTILNIASTDGIDTYSKYNMLYAASKAGVINMTRSMALSTKNKVLCLCPNWLDSESTRSMDREYLNSELERIRQGRLISLSEFNECVNKIIKENKSGDVMRLDTRGEELWITKVL